MSVIQLVGFLLASYAVVGNDSLQTLGSYLSSNKNITPKSLQMIFICGITLVVLFSGWVLNSGDPSWSRLDRFSIPDQFTWVYLIPPIAVLFLTRWGAPVSTSFLVLSTFTLENSDDLIFSSLQGYLIAFALAFVVYGSSLWMMERFILSSSATNQKPAAYWFALQWLSTGLLWSQWLVQDLANIFIYLPRDLSLVQMGFASLILCLGLCFLIANGGGPIQQVLQTKTNTSDLRAATFIDLLFALVLFLKASLSTFPLSTTWVFLGLLAGREIAIILKLRNRTPSELPKILGKDFWKAGIAVVVSLAVALLIQPLTALT